MHIAVGAAVLEGWKGKENCAVSRIFKGEFTRGGRGDGKMYPVLWKRQLKPTTVLKVRFW